MLPLTNTITISNQTPLSLSLETAGKMSNMLWKNIHLCIPKFKCLPTNLSPPPTNDYDEEEDENLLQMINPTSNVALIKNFNSVDDIASASTSKSLTYSTEDNYFSSTDDCDDIESIPDFSTVFASQRFFFSSPGKSNSIVESPERRPVLAENNKVVSGGVAIQTYSPDPYADFRRSMQEMVEAHELRDLKADWDFLHELLLCYLSLNPKHTHKVIIGAFTDLIVSLMSSSKPSHGHRKTDVNHHFTPSRLLV